MQTRKPRHAGARWTMIYGTYTGIEKTAINRLNQICQYFLPYVLESIPANENVKERNQHLILVGTPESNSIIAELIHKEKIKLPEKSDAFTVACVDSPWNAEFRILVIAGQDENGVLYGVSEFDARIATAKLIPDRPTPDELRNAFDSMENFEINEFPRIENRGIWTWGYVIYDYKKFIDNMARLKMNMLTIWNDCPPANIRDAIDYAKSRGVKIILGFHWGWGMDFDLASDTDRQKIKENVLNEYSTNYRDLDIDGIYFQTLTEHRDLEIGGRSVATVVCEMVNEIAGELLQKKPDLQILFGLHATSIRERYPDLAALDPRITIVWEDAGTLPYAYKPELFSSDLPEEWRSFEETLEYSLKIATFRKNAPFAMVPKGWMCIDWDTEFEHHQNFILGERDPEFISQRLAARQPLWDQVNTHWFRNYPQAIHFYREILNCGPASMTVTGLIEDGMFEERIQSSVALFAETIWNPFREPAEILELALSPAYSRK